MVKPYRIRASQQYSKDFQSFRRQRYSHPSQQVKFGGNVGPGTRAALVNIAGLSALIVFTALVYIRTQEPLILLIGGLISVVSVIGTTMGKSSWISGTTFKFDKNTNSLARYGFKTFDRYHRMLDVLTEKCFVAFRCIKNGVEMSGNFRQFSCIPLHQ